MSVESTTGDIITAIQNIPSFPTSLTDVSKIIGIPIPTVNDLISLLPSEIASAFRLRPVGSGIGEISGFKFDIIESHSLSSSVRVNSYPVEDGKFLSDGISWEPLKYTMTGKLADLAFVPQKPQTIWDQLPEKFTVPLEFEDPELPSIEDIKKQIKGIFEPVTNTVEDTVNLLKDFQMPSSIEIDRRADPPSTRSGNLSTTLIKFQRQGIPFKVFSPFIPMEYALISSITFDTEHESGVVSVSIVLEEFRKIELGISEYDPSRFKGRASSQNSNLQKKTGNKSMLKKLLSGGAF